MNKRLTNDEITQRIMAANSDLKRYLTLAPGLDITSPKPTNTNNSKMSVSLPSLARPILRP